MKNWTRNVNIFKKDFLIVPINKDNHWYLAIICYPYLTKPVYKVNPDDRNIKQKSSSSTESSQSSSAADTESASKFKVNTYHLNFDTDSDDESNKKTVASETVKEDMGSCEKMSVSVFFVIKILFGSFHSRIFKLNFRPVILIFDSLNNSKQARVIATLKQ